MLLEGSCHCQAVRFSVESAQPYPFMRCYCSICRKTAGSGGYAINLGANHDTLQVQGRENISIYRAMLPTKDGGQEPSSGHRHFCSQCGSALWLWDPSWPHLVHPHASAIDTPLPVPPRVTHMMLGSKASWVQPDIGPLDKTFDGYPDESLAQWHSRLGLTADPGNPG